MKRRSLCWRCKYYDRRFSICKRTNQVIRKLRTKCDRFIRREVKTLAQAYSEDKQVE